MGATPRNGALPKRKSALRLAMAADGTLTRSALALGIVLLEHIYAEDGYCGETIGDLGAEINIDDDRWVRRLLAELVERGYFRSERGGGRGRPNRFFIADEADKKGVHQTPLSPEKGGSSGAEKGVYPCRNPGLGPSASPCNHYEPASPQLTKKERRKEGARSRAQGSSDFGEKEAKKAGDGTNGSERANSTEAVTAMLRTLRAEIGDHAYRTWLAPLQLVGADGGRLTFRAPSRFHRDHVAGRYVSRMETLTGGIVEVEVVGGTPIARPPAPPPPSPPPPPEDRPDFSLLLQAMPPAEPDHDTANPHPPPLPVMPPPAPSTRRKVSGFSRDEIEAGALDAPWPTPPPPPLDAPPPASDDDQGAP